MKYKEFKVIVLECLSDYRQQELNISKMGCWKGKPYGHILPKYMGDRNILARYRTSFLHSEIGNIKLHRYFHHLNSSQAMCINFFFPLFIKNKLNFVTDYFGFRNEVVDSKSAQFEKESEIDGIGNRRPTQFDFYFNTESGKRFFFETKYTEYGFGSATDDAEHRDKYKEVYIPHLSRVVQPEYSEVRTFFKYYQIIRNLIHIDKDSYVVFLYPNDNSSVARAAEFAKKEILKQQYSEHLLNVTWEDITPHSTSKCNR